MTDKQKLEAISKLKVIDVRECLLTGLPKRNVFMTGQANMLMRVMDIIGTIHDSEVAK